jgi:hypothetical protein
LSENQTEQHKPQNPAGDRDKQAHGSSGDTILNSWIWPDALKMELEINDVLVAPGGANSSLSAKSFHNIRRLQKRLSRYPFSQNHLCRALAELIAASRIGLAIKFSNSGIE